MQKLQKPQARPENPVDALDDTRIGEMDSMVEESLEQLAVDDIRSFLSIAPAGNRAQRPNAKESSRDRPISVKVGANAKESKKQRKGKKNAPVNRDGNSKKQKPKKGQNKLTARERNAAETARMQVEGFVTFWHDGKWHRVAK